MKTKIIGTDHLMSKEEIYKIIELEKPDVIGVELCNIRLQLMVINPMIEKAIDKIPEEKPEEQKEDNSLIGKITSAVKKKAEEQNLNYGSDMINASKYALENKLPLICIDKDINEIRNLMEKIPQNELAGFMQELQEFEQQQLTNEVDADKVLNQLKTKYPVSYEFLITIRELNIENNILKTIIKYPNKKILIFVGKGHQKKIEENINGK